MKIGIIGLGNFGQFIAKLLASDESLEVAAYDTRSVPSAPGVKQTDLAGVATAEIVIVCVPLAAYTGLLPRLKSLLRPETLVVDVCSIKMEAARRLRQSLPGHQNLLITHPMFGPQSAVNGTAGHTLVVTEATGEMAQKVLEYCQAKLGLRIVRMTSKEHDKVMADVHALTFFVARGLSRTGLSASPFQAPSFQMLLDLVKFDAAHTDDLFRTIELGNPYAKQARNRLLQALQTVHDELDEERL